MVRLGIFVDRCSTGISGFDDMVEGGFVRGSMILLTGVPGTGKTIFGLQFIYNGAVNGENGVYVCVESSPEVIKAQALRLGMNFDDLEKDNKVSFIRFPYDGSKFGFLKVVDQEVKRIGAKRMVFDNLATLNIRLGKYVSLWGNEDDTVAGQSSQIAASAVESVGKERLAHSVIEQLRTMGTTTLLITFGNDDQRASVTSDEVSEFLCDGIVQLYNLPIGIRYERSLRIGKMRNTNNSPYIHSFDITGKGIIVKPVEAVYND